MTCSNDLQWVFQQIMTELIGTSEGGTVTITEIVLNS